MKFLFVALLAVLPVQDVQDEPITMSAGERRFLVKRFMDMQQKIDELENALQAEKTRSGCA